MSSQPVLQAMKNKKNPDAAPGKQRGPSADLIADAGFVMFNEHVPHDEAALRETSKSLSRNFREALMKHIY